MIKVSPWTRLLLWRSKNLSDQRFINILSVFIGIGVGFAAVVIKNLVHYIRSFLVEGPTTGDHFYFYFLYPILGILTTVIIIRFFIRRDVGHGVPKVLYTLSKGNGKVSRHNLFSSIITSAFTVGFGGSVGLEGPTVATGAAIGSQTGQRLHLDYKQLTVLIACASAAAMSAIFKSPIAAIVFVLEVIMIDFSLASLVPILIASVSGALTSYFFLGKDVLLPFELGAEFNLGNTHFYILLGFFAGLVSLYFTRVYKFIEEKYVKIKKWYAKLITGGIGLGIMIFFLPVLYGEGYNSINSILHGDYTYLFDNSIYYNLKDNAFFLLGVLFLVIMIKPFATSLTFAAGGIGGMFAPTLFLGANAGLFFTLILGYFGIDLPVSSFSLIGMAGLISGVLHAPLTGIFLIAEITGGYELFLPLMICATISYVTVKLFETRSVYTYQLDKRGELMTHDKDKRVLIMMSVEKVIEKDFKVVPPHANLGDLVKIVTQSKRNIFPVVDDQQRFYGIVKLDHIRHIMFDREKYESIFVRDLMYMPEFIIRPEESMQEVVRKFQKSSRFTIPVLNGGKYYVGFVSRAKCFSAYQKLIKDFSED
jgi:CIC family chloride channel protein